MLWKASIFFFFVFYMISKHKSTHQPEYTHLDYIPKSGLSQHREITVWHKNLQFFTATDKTLTHTHTNRACLEWAHKQACACPIHSQKWVHSYLTFSIERCLLEHFEGYQSECFLKALSDLYNDQLTETIIINVLPKSPTTSWGNTCMTDFLLRFQFKQGEIFVKRGELQHNLLKILIPFSSGALFSESVCFWNRHRRVGRQFKEWRQRSKTLECKFGPDSALLWAFVGPSQSLQPFRHFWIQVSKQVLRSGSLNLKQKFQGDWRTSIIQLNFESRQEWLFEHPLTALVENSDACRTKGYIGFLYGFLKV